MMVGHKPRGKGIVVGEGFGGKRRHHHCLHPLCSHGIEKGRIVGVAIVPAETVERHDNGVLFFVDCPQSHCAQRQKQREKQT